MTIKSVFIQKNTISQTFSYIGRTQRMKIYKWLIFNMLSSKTIKNRFLMTI